MTTSAPIPFTATLRLDGKTATGIEVPADIVERLGGGRRPAVVATLGDHVYRSTIATRRGAYKLPVSAEHRAAAGVAAGQTVAVTVALDAEPREVAVPDDLAAALADTRPAFDALAPSRRKAIVTAVNEAKAPETRRRRIEKAVETLRAG